MKIETLPLSQITPYDRNPRRNDHAVDAVAASIREFGFKVPLVIDAAGVIVTGHTRYKAAQKLGLTEAPCIRADDLTPEQVRAFRLADNKVGELADWDEDLLAGELEALPDFEMEAFGFDLPEAPRGELQDAPMPDEAAQRVQPGQIWRCGDHLVMCGDATKAEDVAALMDGDRCDVTFSSPPYNMNVRNRSFSRIGNAALGGGQAYSTYQDGLSDGDYCDMLDKALNNALTYTDDVLFNIGILQGSKVGLCDFLQKNKKRLLEIIVWNKPCSLPMGLEAQKGILSHRCELIFCFNKKGTRNFSHPQWAKGDAINRIDSESESNDHSNVHHATFPISLCAKVVGLFTERTVLDLFGGSGTTMIAAEQLGRRARLMEIDPQYCDIILTRWEQFTGRKAERVS